MARRGRDFAVTLPPRDAVRVERLKLRATAAGLPAPSDSALLRHVIEKGLDAIEAPAAAHLDVAPAVTA